MGSLVWHRLQRIRPGLQVRCQPPDGFSAVETATAVVQEQDVLQECQTLLQQQLPADSSLQQLLEPLIPVTTPGPDSGTNSASSMPGDDVATIAAPSTSITVNVPSPEAMAAAAVMAAAATIPQPIDVEAKEIPSTWRSAPAFAQLPAAAAEPSAQQHAEQRQDFKHWARVVGVCGFAALLCYLDRTNISTAIVPMAEQYGWNKQFCSIVMSAFFAGYGATQVWGGQLSDKYGGSAVLAAGLGVWSLATVLTPISAALGTWQLLTARVVLGMAQGIAFPAIHALLAKKVSSPYAQQVSDLSFALLDLCTRLLGLWSGSFCSVSLPAVCLNQAHVQRAHAAVELAMHTW